MKRKILAPTLDDVARYAGVSTASVSRVLNQVGPVSDALRDRVELAVKQVGYRRKHGNAEHPTAPIQTVAIVYNDVLNPYFHQIVQGAQDEAEANGMLLVAVNTPSERPRQRRELDMLMRLPLTGLILAANILSPSELIDFYEHHPIPIVAIHQRVTHQNIASIVVDFEGAGARAANQLLEMGHTRIAYLAGPSSAQASQDRRRGIVKALSERQLSLDSELCPSSMPSLEGGFQSMTSILALPHEKQPTAVIAYDDLVAIGALNAIRVHGLRVPDDIAIIGFDDIPMSAHTNPPLTTFAVPKYQMGKIAIQNLIQIRRGELAQGGYTLLENRLVVRASLPLTPPRPIAAREIHTVEQES